MPPTRATNNIATCNIKETHITLHEKKTITISQADDQQTNGKCKGQIYNNTIKQYKTLLFKNKR